MKKKTTNELPESVVIMGIEYTVLLMADDSMNILANKEGHDPAFFRGLIDFKECYIYINNTLSPAMRIRTLAHEMIHGYEEALSLDFDEGTTQRVTTFFFDMLRSNDFLIKEFEKGGA